MNLNFILRNRYHLDRNECVSHIIFISLFVHYQFYVVFLTAKMGLLHEGSFRGITCFYAQYYLFLHGELNSGIRSPDSINKSLISFCPHFDENIFFINRKSFKFASRFSRTFVVSSEMMAIRKQVLTRGVIGNTSDFGSEESRFEPWRVNMKGIISKRWSFLLFEMG